MWQIATFNNTFAKQKRHINNLIYPMKFNTILLICVIAFPTIVYAQKGDKAYKRYEGNIGSSISITANIVQLYEKLSGNYQYKYIEDDANMHYGKSIELSGEIDENNNAKLREFGSKEFTFIGKIDDNTFNGDWNAGDDRKVPFEMAEYYPNGSMPFDVHYLRSEGKLVKGEADSPVAEIEMTLIYPTNDYVQPEIADSVKKIIVNSYFGPGFEVNNPDSMMLSFEKEYLEKYVKQNENWHEVGGASFNWENMISMSVVYNTGYMLCIEYLKYAYSGGSHGMTNLSYDIIYLDNGELLTFADVFKGDEEAKEKLTQVLTKQLRKDYSIPDEVLLSEAGFFVEKVEPNRNIYVNGNGVGFLYNSYEIAPYSQGSTNIFLEFSQIKDLVKMGTPVYQMTKR